MTKPRLAVDFDSVLANTSAVAFDLICGPDHNYTVEDVESWTWGFDEFGEIRYLNALWNAWTLRPYEVPKMEVDVEGKMGALNDKYHVDIVTAHPDNYGISEGKKKWLDHQNIPHEKYYAVSTDESKADLDYDAFIDDKPSLPSEASADQTVYLRDQAWNQDAEGDYIRVKSILDAMVEEIAIY